ncbi:MAG: M48 family metalloprotease [Thermoleophilaceae bacterium]|nr:M48 family metalloprotease [Thermoleophilaceae bacterium]
MEARRSRVPAAILVAVVAAGAATLLLRPRHGLIEPASVRVEDYFSPAELKRAEDFRDPQRLIGLAQLALTGGALVLLALRPPRLLVRRPLAGGAAVGAGISLVLVGVHLPLAAVAHDRAVDVGLSTQDWGEWLGDVGKSAALEAGFAALGGLLALALVRRFRRRWWVPGSAAVVAVGVITVWLFPVVIDPLFNKFEPLPDGKLRSQVLELAKRADVDVGQVYRVDASRRTTGVNAYVNGLGHSKRVVLYDNLIEGLPRDQVLQVVAHELGHQHHRDLLRGLAWLAIVAPAGTWLAMVLAERIGRREGLGDPSVKPGASALPALALSVALVSFGLGIAGNQLSKPVEASADSFSLDLTRNPAAHIALERELAVRNVSDPEPPAITQWLFGTHPTTVQRIGIGEAWAREH